MFAYVELHHCGCVEAFVGTMTLTVMSYVRMEAHNEINKS